MAHWSPRKHWLVGATLVTAAAVALMAAQWGQGWPAVVPPTELSDVCVVAPPTRYDPAWGVGLHDPRPIPADARCPVCGMFPARSPQWAAQVVFEDGATQFFDSPVSMFTYLGAVERYAAGRSVGQIVAQYVKDSSTDRWWPAQQAFYVNGSNALGPMRAGNLPAFAREDDAQHFAQQRGGQVMSAHHITPALLRTLAGHAHHAQPGAR